MQDDKLKIFISWSGLLAQGVTTALKSWLPELLDVEPWASHEDIDAGSRWGQDITTQLDASSFGVIVVTATNQHAPWLNFEAGALSKRFGTEAKTYVAPVLVDLASSTDVTGPVAQFQMNRLDKPGMENVIKTITKVVAADWTYVGKRFERSWDEFNAAIEEVKAAASNIAKVPSRTPDDLLKEILATVRDLRRNEGINRFAGRISLETLKKRELHVAVLAAEIFEQQG